MFTTQGNTITVNDKENRFHAQIERVVDCKEYLLVEFPPAISKDSKDISFIQDDTYAISSSDGSFLWSMSRFPGVVLHTNPCNFKLAGNTLTINGHSVTFDAPIRQIREQNEVLIVLLLNTPQNDMKQNVFGVSGDGRILWRIPKLPEGFSNTDQWNFFTEIRTSSEFEAKGVVDVHNALDWMFTVNVHSGEIISYRYYKL